LTRRCVLVVEDERSHGDLLATLLEEAGFRAVCDADGALTPSLARALRPGVITLDLEMPGLDGRSVLRALKAEPATARIPIIVVSAHADLLAVEDRHAAFAVIPKPFDLDELLATVRRAVGE
jgi:DNA-binding response OmpR family regulator